MVSHVLNKLLLTTYLWLDMARLVCSIVGHGSGNGTISPGLSNDSFLHEIGRAIGGILMTSRKSRKWSLRWSVPLVLALAIGSGYWGLVGGCGPAEDGNGNGNGGGNGGGNGAVNASTCEPLDNTDGGFEIQVFAVSSEGRELTYTMRQTSVQTREAAQDDNIDDFDPLGLNTETVVLSDGLLLMSITTLGDSTRQEVTVDYGTLITGIESSLAIVEDGMLSGMINDRELVPVPVEEADPNTPVFVDGEPAPVAGIPSDLQEILIGLFEAAEVASQACEAQNGTDAAKVTRTSSQDTGHGSHPTSSGACIGCRTGCSGAAIGCVAGFAAGCVAATFAYAACKALGCGGCAIAYTACFGACSITGAPCCPVGCGDVACCEVDETCLNFDIGLCCSPGKTTCVGESCCSSTETCIDTGPNAGTCCQPELICGNTCCDPTESCIAEVSLCCPSGMEPCGDKCCPSGESCLGDGVGACDDKCCPSGEICIGDGLCCDPTNACGSACCDELFSGCIASLSLCCGFAQPPCGNKCCGISETCLGGTECCPVNLLCGSICCDEGSFCDSQTNTCSACPDPTDTPCTVGGCCPAGMNCTDFEGICCPQGELYCFGMCRPISECIN